MYQDQGKIDSWVSNKLFYDIDTNGGQSGSPIYNNSQGFVVGIHTSGGDQLNCGVYIALVKLMVKTIDGPPRLEFELDESGKFLSFRSVSMSTFVEPSTFDGDKIDTVLPGGAATWQKAIEVRDNLKKNANSSPLFQYELEGQTYQARVSLARRKSPSQW